MPRKGPGLSKAADRLRTDARAAVQAAGALLGAQVISELSTPGRGRIYEKYKPRRTHQASAPLDPPAPDTGALRNSVTLAETPTGVEISTSLEYAPYLEFGTPQMAPRPFFRPAIAKVKDQLGPQIVATLQRGRA